MYKRQAYIKQYGGTKVLLHYGGKSAEKSGLLERIKTLLSDAGLAYVCLLYTSEQIREQIKESILKGEIEPGSMLPSIRVLASQCKVGVITVKRAYEELEKEGLIFNRQGKGCFVKEINQTEVMELYEQQLKEKIIELRRFCKKHAISETRMMTLMNEYKEEE